MSDSLLDSSLLDFTCLACGFHRAMPLFTGTQKPLATLGWPQSPEQSIEMPHYPLDFIRCLRCGHIYNYSFEYQNVPYVKNPNLMYNQSTLWQKHQHDLSRRLIGILSQTATVIEIGCGTGGFLRSMAEFLPNARFIGFDPNNDNIFEDHNIKLIPELFIPSRDLQKYQPDLILSRHVLEHLMNPLAFLQELAVYSSYHQLSPKLFFEVPCVDRLLKYGRLEDLYYEHNSHFTSHSFEALLKNLPCQIEFIEHGYNQEVIFGLIQLQVMPLLNDLLIQTDRFRKQIQSSSQTIPAQIASLLASGQTLCLWGGTGKGAAFVHHFNLNSDQIPLRVVDSDLSKVGTYVPGTRYFISSPKSLLEDPVDIIIIPAQWRAQDIVVEIKSSQIAYKTLFIEHQGQLIDFFKDIHPYQMT